MLRPMPIALLAALGFLHLAPAHADPAAPDEIDLSKTAIQLGEVTLDPRIGIRLRAEGRDNLDLRGPDSSAESARLLLRTSIGVEVKFRFLSALIDVTDGRDFLELESSDDAPIDFTQAFVALDKPLGVPLTLKLGRQAMNLGSRRLVSTSSWGNKLRSWDLARIGLDLDRFQVDVFGGSVVDIDPDGLDRWRSGETLWGVFSTIEVSPTFFTNVYVLGLWKAEDVDPAHPIAGEDGQTGDAHRVTPGIRLWGSDAATHLDWELEAAFQIGNQASDDIHAFALHGSLSWTLPATAGGPVLGLDINYASGDADPEDGLDQTFVPLYGTTHEPYGLADLFRWQNMIEAALGLDFDLGPKVRLRLEQHAFWLAETTDDWVNSSGKVLRKGVQRRADEEASLYAGQEWGCVLTWQAHPLLKLEGGFSYFLAGTFARETGSPRSAAFGHVLADFRF